MKTLALFLLAAFPAQAEVEKFLLTEHGAWSVYFNSKEDGTAFCSTEIGTYENAFFSIDVSSEKLEAWHVGTNVEFGPEWIVSEVSLTVDSNRPWTFSAKGIYDAVVLEKITYKFLVELAGGSRLRIDLEGDGASEALFSLHGLDAALISLTDCAEKIGATL